MIVKVESKNGNFCRWDECNIACITEDRECSNETKGYILICTYNNGRDNTYPLSKDEKVYFMNSEGKTIDQDFRRI